MEQWLSLIILVLTLLGMIFEDVIGIKLCIAGAIGAIALILTGVISEKQALASIDLKTIFLFGGTLSLASALDESGAGEMIANKVVGLLGDNPSPYLFTVCCVYALLCAHQFHEQYCNNRADGSDLCVHRKRNGSRSECCSYGLCDRRFLRICNTNRYAGQHHGSYGRRLYL